MSRAIDRVRDAAGSLRRSLRGARPRLALVTPWPPERSGIAGYSARLARALARDVDVDVVVSDQLERYEAPREPGVTLVSASAPPTDEWLRRQRHVLYCMGNSGFHAHVYSLLREHPGPVLLHDVQLTGFFGTLAGSQRPEDPNGWLLEQVERHYGGDCSREQLRSAMLSSREREARRIYMTAEIRRFASRLFVHSRFAADVVARDRGRDVPVTVMPFGVPTPTQDARGAATQTPQIVHLGALSETKSTATLIEAFGALGRRRPGARLVLVGSADESGPAHWQALARAHAPAESIEISGFVDEQRYEGLLRSADVAVQLRAVSNGEASAAVADCLAAGIPTIVTDLAWTGELPSSAVRHVPVGVSAASLAAQIDELIADPRERLALSAGALAFAGAHSFQTVADAYLRELGLA